MNPSKSVVWKEETNDWAFQVKHLPAATRRAVNIRHQLTVDKSGVFGRMTDKRNRESILRPGMLSNLEGNSLTAIPSIHVLSFGEGSNLQSRSTLGSFDFVLLNKNTAFNFFWFTYAFVCSFSCTFAICMSRDDIFLVLLPKIFLHNTKHHTTTTADN